MHLRQLKKAIDKIEFPDVPDLRATRITRR
jgi:hypothetical protein